MKYMGSKLKIAKEILPIVLKNREKEQYYVEPFVGGCNIIDKVEGNRIGGDSNHYLISFWKMVQQGWIPPNLTKEDYLLIKEKKEKYSEEIVGWAGIGCSYSGKWFGGYAGKTKTKIGTVRDYVEESLNAVKEQSKKIKDVIFYALEYDKLIIPENSIIYCDPPYQGTTKYKDDFDHEKFWEWCRKITKKGNKIFISEYNAPSDFDCVWEKKVSSSLSANGKSGGNKISTEKLFVYER